MKDLSNFREEYTQGTLNEADMHAEPISQFVEWLQIAIDARLFEANAMVLATCTPEGKPSARVVLLKEVNKDGFVFFTNYESRKGNELTKNPFASLVFDWHPLEKQVRIEGTVERLSKSESDEYFNSRPQLAKMSATISRQSSILKKREELELLKDNFEKANADKPIMRPTNWGGFLVKPTKIEFWQGRANRLHDRIVYRKTESGWDMHRLAP